MNDELAESVRDRATFPGWRWFAALDVSFLGWPVRCNHPALPRNRASQSGCCALACRREPRSARRILPLRALLPSDRWLEGASLPFSDAHARAPARIAR